MCCLFRFFFDSFTFGAMNWDASHPSQDANGIRRFRFDPNLKRNVISSMVVMIASWRWLTSQVTNMFMKRRRNWLMFMIGILLYFCCMQKIRRNTDPKIVGIPDTKRQSIKRYLFLIASLPLKIGPKALKGKNRLATPLFRAHVSWRGVYKKEVVVVVFLRFSTRLVDWFS